MKNRPLPVIIVAVLFILVGCMGFGYHLKDLFEVTINRYETIWVLLLRIVAIACGLMLLYRINWARWLAVAWLAYHVVISALNSTSEMVMHLAFLILVSVLLFLPVSSAYFKKKRNNKNQAA
jgi:hypothetical protein